MIKMNRIWQGFIAITFFIAFSAHAAATTVEVKMVNKGSDGTWMTFDPPLVKIALGDSVHFVPVDMGHDIESIPGMLPDRGAPFAAERDKPLTVKFDRPGLYAYRCIPHYAAGMVGIVMAGDAENEAAIKKQLNSGDVPGAAKQRFIKLLKKLDEQK